MGASVEICSWAAGRDFIKSEKQKKNKQKKGQKKGTDLNGTYLTVNPLI